MKERFGAYFTTIIAVLVYKRVQRQYTKAYGKRLEVIGIAGNIGKSTLTLLTSQLFRYAGYTVISGTSPDHNYNTPLGLLYTLCGKKPLLYYVQIILGIKQLPVVSSNSILVQELGVDEEGGASRYTKIFGSFDVLLMAGVASEHTGGFSTQLRTELLKSITTKIPKIILDEYHTIKDPRTQNVVLEQLYLIQYADFVVIPTSLNSLSGESISFGKNYKNKIVLGNIIKSDRYVLPSTFAIFESILQQLVLKYSLDKSLVSKVCNNLILPHSRFSKFKGSPPFEYIVDSTYNSDPLSLSGFLDMVKSSLKNSVLVLGEMRELGESAYQEHSLVIDRLNKDFEGVVTILVGSEWDADLVHPHIKCVKTTAEAILELEKIRKLRILKDNSWLWVKGSQNTIFLEELVKYFLNTPSDSKYICRQNKHWMKTKKPFVD